jgi:nitrogen fixation protein NifX
MPGWRKGYAVDCRPMYSGSNPDSGLKFSHNHKYLLLLTSSVVDSFFIHIKWEMKSMKVAIVSSDGKVINQHFGKASKFFIFEVDCGKIQFLEVRETTPLCGSSDSGHADDLLSRIVSLISDCDALLCSRIGSRPQEELKKKGIKAIEAPYFIDEALKDMSKCE